MGRLSGLTPYTGAAHGVDTRYVTGVLIKIAGMKRKLLFASLAGALGGMFLTFVVINAVYRYPVIRLPEELIPILRDSGMLVRPMQFKLSTNRGIEILTVNFADHFIDGLAVPGSWKEIH